MADDGEDPTAAEPAVRGRRSQPVISSVVRFEPGEVVASRYRITKLVAHGGMGDVYEATDVELRTEIALKTIRGAPSDAGVERFRREIFLARKVTHPNVCRVFDLGRHRVAGGGEILFITMELLRGETLAAYIKARGKLSTQEALPIVRQVAAAMDAAHAVGVVHRDLKPGNVMLVTDEAGGKPRALVTDFGVAHGSGDPFDDISGTGDVVGSPAYMSPEQIEGGTITPSADIYALGVVMFEMVTGRRPFQGESSISAIVKRLKVDPPRPTTHVPELSPVWEDVILRCLARAPSGRFASGQEIVDALTGGPTAPVSRFEPIGEELPDATVRTPSSPSMVVGSPSAASAAPPSPSPSRRRNIAIVAGLLALVVVAVVAGFVWTRSDDKASGADAAAGAKQREVVSVAVLPFKDTSPQKDQEYLSDGISEELLVHLSRVEDLRVVARSSAFSFKSSADSPAAIAKKLGVTHLVEGSVAKSEDRIRITARLVRASDGTQLWAESFDRTGRDVFAMQDEIANAVATALQVKLAARSATGARTTNPAAHEQLLRGRALARRDRREDLEQAAAAFEAAIDLDASYAPPYAGLAFVLSYLADYSPTPEARQARIERAHQLARKAIALGPEVAEAHRVLGHLQFSFGWEWDGAKASFARALELEPRDADTLRRAAMMYGALGDLARASALSQQAVEIDPIASASWNTVGIMHAAAGRLGEARKAVVRALELNPKSMFARHRISIFEVLEGRPDAALANAAAYSNPSFKLVTIAIAEHARGKREASQAALEKLIATEAHTFAYQIAQVFAWRGELDAAFSWLDKAYAQRDGGLQEVRYDPLFGKLRADPRFETFLVKMRLPP